ERVPARQQVDAGGGEGEAEEPPEGARRRSPPRDEGVRAEEARRGGAVAEEVPVREGAEERVHGDHVREPGRDQQSEERGRRVATGEPGAGGAQQEPAAA